MEPYVEAWRCLHQHPGVAALLAGLLGTLFGSFANVLIYRIPHRLREEWKADAAAILDLPAKEIARDDTLTRPSACPQCQHRLAWWELVPVLSWILLRGQCSACHTAISRQYPVIEALVGLVFAAATWRFGLTWATPAVCLLSLLLVTAAVIDLKTQILPDTLTLKALWLGLGISVFGIHLSPQDAILGASAGYFSLWLPFWAYKLLRGIEGMGYGDFKLMAALGAWVGPAGILPILIIASLLSVVGGVIHLRRTKQSLRTAFSFGPALTTAGLVVLLWGPL